MINQTLKEQVREILAENIDARNSDITLTIALWKRYWPQKVNADSVLLSDLYELPREDNIKRIRAKFQQEALARLDAGNPENEDWIFLPSDPDIVEQRGILAAQWQKALGYWNWIKKPKQTEQLPRPVGKLGYSFMGSTPRGEHFIFSGAMNKEYNVYFSNGIGNCECESYRFSIKKTCKHIAEAAKFVKLRREQAAAAHQQAIF